LYTGPDFDVKDRIKQASDIVDVVGGYLPLRRQGTNFVAHCPWHDDSRPSLQVNQVRQSWVCWVCNFRGDVFDFVMRRESVEFFEAMQILAERAGIEIKRTGQKVEKGSPQDKQALFRAMAWAVAQYHDCLLNEAVAAPVRNYLADRNVTPESIEAFKIGFAPLAWSWLVDRARHTEFSPEVLEACGLVSANNSGGWYERFRGRVLFPISDTQNRPIALGGRIVPDLVPDDQQPKGKYYNSTETRLYSKSDNLFGLNLVRDEVSKKENRKLTIVEGYTDVVAAYQAGLRNVIACQGTAVNERHIKVMRRFADSITLVLDGDEAGQRRTNEILDLFVAQDVDLRILSLPEGADPFDFIRDNGADAFQSLVDSANDAIAHKINQETRGVDLINDTHAANQALEAILKTLAQIPVGQFATSAAKSVRLDQLITRIARQFQLDRTQVKNRLNELRRTMSRARPTVNLDTSDQNQATIDFKRLPHRESELLQLLIGHPELLDQAIESISPNQIPEGPLRDLYEVMNECFHVGKDVGYNSLMLELEDVNLKSLVDYLHGVSTEKQSALANLKNGIAIEPLAQLESIIDAFNNMADASGTRSQISRLHGRQLDDDEEASALEELLKLARQRQGL
jgi:DNA primase